jgi:hypothetical protein
MAVVVMVKQCARVPLLKVRNSQVPVSLAAEIRRLFGAAIHAPESEHFRGSDGKMICVPRVSLADFCRDHGVSDTIQHILAKEGFKTAGAVLEVSEDILRTTRLKIGEIGELKRGLREFISEAIIACDYHRENHDGVEGLSGAT